MAHVAVPGHQPYSWLHCLLARHWKRSYRVVADGVVGELQKHKALPSNQPCPLLCVCAPGLR